MKRKNYLFSDQFMSKFVRYLPKRLIYFCTMNLGGYVTSGKYGLTFVNELKFMDAVKRYGDDFID